MKKIGKLTIASLLAVLGVTTMASCGGEKTTLADEVLSKVIITEENEDVSEDFTIPKTVTYKSNVYDITWKSSDSTVLSIEDTASDSTHFYTADVHQPFDANKDITLTASTTVEGVTKSVNFKTTVVKTDLDSALAASASKVVFDNKLTSISEAKEINLPAKSNEYGEEITLTYALGATYKTASLAGTKLTFNPAAGADKVALSITATCGSKNVTKTFNVNVADYLTVAEALDKPEDTMMYVQGKIKSIASTTYGNFWIEDEAGNEIYIYGLYKGAIEECYNAENVWQEKGTRYDAWESSEKLAVGDYVFVYGKRDVFEKKDGTTTQQIATALIQSYPYSTVSDVLDLPENLVVTMYATVKSIESTKYGNITLVDAAGKTIPTYGLYRGDASKITWNASANFVTPNGVDKPAKYGDWKAEDQLAVGDVIVIVGPKTVYKNAPQVKNPLILSVLKKAPAKPAVTIEMTVDKTITFDDAAKRTEFDKNHQIWVENGITVTNEKAASTTDVAPKYFNPARFYKSSDVTISAEQNIRAVVFTYKYDDKMPEDTFTLEGCQVQVDKTTKTCKILLDTPAKSFKITKLPQQWQVVSIGVDFAE